MSLCLVKGSDDSKQRSRICHVIHSMCFIEWQGHILNNRQNKQTFWFTSFIFVSFENKRYRLHSQFFIQLCCGRHMTSFKSFFNSTTCVLHLYLQLTWFNNKLYNTLYFFFYFCKIFRQDWISPMIQLYFFAFPEHVLIFKSWKLKY